MNHLINYSSGDKSVWSGRIDDIEDEDSLRWHQMIEPLDLNSPLKKQTEGFCFLGFRSDAGVKRNKGREGAALGSEMIRNELCNLPYGFAGKPKLYDAGDVHCLTEELELAQQQLAEAVKRIRSIGLFPIVLGGGHEIALGHYNGLKSSTKSKLGIINLDAHFDLRPYKNGGSSGSMFLQIADNCMSQNEEFRYMVMGIQTYGNTVSLFKKADELKTKYILAKDITEVNLPEIYEHIDGYLKKQEDIYLTICTDVISAAYAPGVSASQPFGLHPDIVLKINKHILKSGKVIGFDFAEVSPRFDTDNRTAKLVAVNIYAMINTLMLMDDPEIASPYHRKV
ncbi:MAG: formimidoylglutamase [Bacteroidales bacterium]|nr:formimidoylglutamase [Bacteroidales bacterium]